MARALSPWLRLGEVTDEELERVARRGRAADARARSTAAAGKRASTGARAGPARAAATPIRSRGQGDDNRIAYWCPGCQRGEEPPGA